MKIGFFLKYGYRILIKELSYVRNGSVVQLSEIIINLKNAGHSVYIICEAPKYGLFEHNGFTFFGLPKERACFNRIRVSIGLLIGIMSINADVYICRLMGQFLPQLRIITFMIGRPLIFSLANMLEADGTCYSVYLTPLLGWLTKWAFHHCDCIVTQTSAQQNTLFEKQNLSSKLIGNGIDLHYWQYKKEQKSDIVAWVGNIRPIKRFDRLIEIAILCPETSFVVAGGIKSDYLIELNNSPANINYVGALSKYEVRELMAEASILLNTSDSEGFPNTFLEARAMGVYVICIDLEELRSELFGEDEQLGYLAIDTRDATHRIKFFFSKNSEYRKQCSEKAISWVKRYSFDHIINKWDNLLTSVVNNKECF